MNDNNILESQGETTWNSHIDDYRYTHSTMSGDITPSDNPIRLSSSVSSNSTPMDTYLKAAFSNPDSPISVSQTSIDINFGDFAQSDTLMHKDILDHSQITFPLSCTEMTTALEKEMNNNNNNTNHTVLMNTNKVFFSKECNNNNNNNNNIDDDDDDDRGQISIETDISTNLKTKRCIHDFMKENNNDTEKFRMKIATTEDQYTDNDKEEQTTTFIKKKTNVLTEEIAERQTSQEIHHKNTHYELIQQDECVNNSAFHSSTTDFNITPPPDIPPVSALLHPSCCNNETQGSKSNDYHKYSTLDNVTNANNSNSTSCTLDSSSVQQFLRNLQNPTLLSDPNVLQQLIKVAATAAAQLPHVLCQPAPSFGNWSLVNYSGGGLTTTASPIIHPLFTVPTITEAPINQMEHRGATAVHTPLPPSLLQSTQNYPLSHSGSPNYIPYTLEQPNMIHSPNFLNSFQPLPATTTTTHSPLSYGTCTNSESSSELHNSPFNTLRFTNPNYYVQNPSSPITHPIPGCFPCIDTSCSPNVLLEGGSSSTLHYATSTPRIEQSTYTDLLSSPLIPIDTRLYQYTTSPARQLNNYSIWDNTDVPRDIRSSLVVHGIPHCWTVDKLRELFCQFGRVLQYRFDIDSVTGTHRGRGFIEFDSPEAARTAILYVDGMLVEEDKRLKVQPKRYTAANWHRQQHYQDNNTHQCCTIHEPQQTGISQYCTHDVLPSHKTTQQQFEYTRINRYHQTKKNIEDNVRHHHESLCVLGTSITFHNNRNKIDNNTLKTEDHHVQQGNDYILQNTVYDTYNNLQEPTNNHCEEYEPTENLPYNDENFENNWSATHTQHNDDVSSKSSFSAVSTVLCKNDKGKENLTTHHQTAKEIDEERHRETSLLIRKTASATLQGSTCFFNEDQTTQSNASFKLGTTDNINNNENNRSRKHKQNNSGVFGGNRVGKGRNGISIIPENNLFVFHIPPDWDEREFRQQFEVFGPIRSLGFPKDAMTPWGHRGYGFVCYESNDDAQQAIQDMDGKEIQLGRRLKVEIKKPGGWKTTQAGFHPNLKIPQSSHVASIDMLHNSPIITPYGQPTLQIFGKPTSLSNGIDNTGTQQGTCDRYGKDRSQGVVDPTRLWRTDISAIYMKNDPLFTRPTTEWNPRNSRISNGQHELQGFHNTATIPSYGMNGGISTTAWYRPLSMIEQQPCYDHGGDIMENTTTVTAVTTTAAAAAAATVMATDVVVGEHVW